MQSLRRIKDISQADQVLFVGPAPVVEDQQAFGWSSSVAFNKDDFTHGRDSRTPSFASLESAMRRTRAFRSVAPVGRVKALS